MEISIVVPTFYSFRVSPILIDTSSIENGHYRYVEARGAGSAKGLCRSFPPINWFYRKSDNIDITIAKRIHGNIFIG